MDGQLGRRLNANGWVTVMRGLVQVGVRRVRLTGGEPLLHPNVVDMVACVASLGIRDVALTTSGTHLRELAGPLRRAGLRRLTVSLDSLDPERFRRIRVGGRLDQVLAGLEEARRIGFDELKTNTVVLRGENDAELPALARFA